MKNASFVILANQIDADGGQDDLLSVAKCT
jgi:hypothetical protein